MIWAETKFELLEKVDRWKQGLEAKGLRVNMGKTKVMQCGVDCGQKESSVSILVVCVAEEQDRTRSSA